MSKHTKGPWEAKRSCSNFIIVGPENEGIGSTGHWLPDEHKEMKANAHLIAAAPDMYEALKELIEVWEDGGCVDALKDVYFMSVSAKAKAEGRE